MACVSKLPRPALIRPRRCGGAVPAASARRSLAIAGRERLLERGSRHADSRGEPLREHFAVNAFGHAGEQGRRQSLELRAAVDVLQVDLGHQLLQSGIRTAAGRIVSRVLEGLRALFGHQRVRDRGLRAET